MGAVLDGLPSEVRVPVSVWRATGPTDPPATATSITRGLTPRLAQMLLGLWTEPGQIVIDTTNDITVRAAATAGGRTYRPLHLPPPAAPVNTHPVAAATGTVALILLRWPPDTTPANQPEPAAVLALCHTLLAPDGHAVVILVPPEDSTYRDIARTVIRAAHDAGLRYLQHLIVITGDHTNHAPTSDQDRHADMLVFVLRRP